MNGGAAEKEVRSGKTIAISLEKGDGIENLNT